MMYVAYSSILYCFCFPPQRYVYIVYNQSEKKLSFFFFISTIFTDNHSRYLSMAKRAWEVNELIIDDVWIFATFNNSEIGILPTYFMSLFQEKRYSATVYNNFVVIRSSNTFVQPLMLLLATCNSFLVEKYIFV